MRRELQAILENDFEFMKRSPEKEQTIYQKWSFECGSGWFMLIYQMASEINGAYIEAETEPDIIIQQIKQKFGVLRTYISYPDALYNLHAIDIINTGTSFRFQSDNDAISEKVKALRKEITDIIKKYEDKSRFTCESCGSSTGILRTELPWIRTLCNDCLNEYYERKKQRQEEKKRLLEEFKDNS